MQRHQVKRKTANKKHVQVGRGGRRGKTSGRGMKGQKSRSGRKIRPEIRDMIKKLPKLRGRGVNTNKSRQIDNKVVKLSDLETNFKANERVTPQSVFDKGLVRKVNGKIPPIKIMASGELKKSLKVKNIKLSKAAREKVEAAGGKVQ